MTDHTDDLAAVLQRLLDELRKRSETFAAAVEAYHNDD